ncbi:ATPase, T2SS/T4P/T4SS family [Komagataeibacter sp. FNDCR2]|uniref:type IV pilus twitching motility protein PilT n=1 Tax=Komagataeibacter sp. FNDCR2 TaxID=2878682 RepID=UPI001E45E7DF|nr:Flp pilus assembly complex ATPase component TadA [Komagataeibacter sp. FNDCR2]
MSNPFWPEDGVSLRGEALDRLLMWCSEQDASRIQLQTDKPIVMKVHGLNRTITREALLPGIVEDAINYMFRDSTAVTHLRQSRALDLSHTIWPDRRARRYSFRINAVPTLVGPEQAVGITIRPLVDIPRPLAEQNVEPRVLEALEGDNGMYLVCGATGSGKTTLLGGINRKRLEDPDCHMDLVEGSAPLELLYDLVPAVNSTVMQTEIPRGLPTFAEFIRAAMRQEPTDIVVGEIRDPETVVAAIQAAISGHRLLSSLHTFDCASTVRRIAALCPADQRDSLTISFVENLRVIVNQRLLRSTDGRRTPIREFLPVSRAFRDRLLDADPKHWPELTRKAVETSGQSFEQSIRSAHREGRITEAVAAAAIRQEL